MNLLAYLTLIAMALGIIGMALWVMSGFLVLHSNPSLCQRFAVAAFISIAAGTLLFIIIEIMLT